ncbi:glucose-1-phosphate adenylyltransferase [Sulfuritalea sp.]|uniref:glucose-1-phosphate adenylyltransferase n=1 Tax=Sulfuritalea sp. TaxID=2480090 RepID=UPI001ACF6DC2|nr:glucose-1-phosphate adenylyltransferase [Sulfuritalea sp.]MBN8476473.1 glucose-1-phosphate adenylyltransferase [Sulfuritalea sp.]
MTATEIAHNTFGIVLAGGRGSRLMQLTDWRSKPAVPFGGKFRIIDFTLSNCVNSGIRRIGVATQYKAQSLIQHLQRGWSFLDGRFHEFIDILPAQQQISEDWYRGTADAVFQNLDLIRRNRPRYVLVLSGDHIYKMNYARMLAEHADRQADFSVACIDVPRLEATEFGVMHVDEQQRVAAFVEKPKDPPAIPGRPDRALASMGVYVFNADFLFEQLIRDHDEPKSSHDFGKDLIPHCVDRYRVFAHNFVDSCVGMDETRIPYWRDAGTIDAYWEANMELTKVTPELNLYDDDWPIWTHQEQLPPAKFVFDDDGRRGMAVDSLVSGGDIISGALVRHSLLFSRVHVHSHAEIEDSVILPDVHIGRHAKLRRVVMDKHCRVPEGLQIGYDREADRKRFHVSDNGVTLVTPEMLGQQAHHIR